MCTDFPRPGPISGYLQPQPQPVFEHSSDVLQCAATSQDSGLVLTACNFSFSSLAINPVCPHRGCLGLVHSRSNTEVLEGGTVLFLFCGVEQCGVSLLARAQTGNPSSATRRSASQGKNRCRMLGSDFQVTWVKIPCLMSLSILRVLCPTVQHHGEGTAWPVPASWSPPAQQLTAMCDT